MNNYFVTYHGNRVAEGLTKLQAISVAKKRYNHSDGMLAIGIGRIKYTPKGRFYTVLPMSYYL